MIRLVEFGTYEMEDYNVKSSWSDNQHQISEALIPLLKLFPTYLSTYGTCLPTEEEYLLYALIRL